MVFSHNPWLVALSFATAAFASFVALDMIERLRQANGRARQVWHAGASAALGGGIWSMHFIGMLAFSGPAELQYDPAMTILSLAIAIVFVGAGLGAMRRARDYRTRSLTAGLLVGLGVSAMHYTGMAAMRFSGTIAYKPSLFALSAVIAAAAAIVALMLAFGLRKAHQRAIAAVVMAFAICGMHYTGMAATVIRLELLAPPTMGTSHTSLAIAVAAGTYGLLFLALVATIADRRMTAAAVREAGRLKVVNLALEQEIGERRRMEEELRVARDELELRVVERTRDLEEARSRAEAANHAKSDFLASMSHELRTPLNAILGFAQLLDFNSAREPLTAKQRRASEQIAKAGRHLLQLIDEVLDLARVEAGHLVLSMEAVDARGLLDEVVMALQPVAQDAGVTLSTLGSEMLPVMADRTRLSQVVTNLVSNAIKYNRRNGTVELSGERRRDGMIEITVRDTGLGIPADRLQDLFVPFNRLGQEYGTIQGTGIGLSITKRLVDAMHGTIGVESTVDVGSVFRVALLLSPVEAQPSLRVPQEATVRAGSHRLLYIEDNPSNIELMRDLVDVVPSLDLQVAADPLIGLDLAWTTSPEVIILDINLPGINGFEVLKRLHADPRSAGIPVIALTANAMPREVEKGLAAGFHCYLTKPLKVTEFLAALDSALERRHAA
ncbi:histidine kinase [Skermanella stibiiresistens SB22]|uniref:histidine kinase n=1 Tax=Skermanella stibiiresistens SB22 TaxID=1385369 RepID=W9GZI5_9PROT|nr:MHYT domain-containing protein [Skermanella stibiiresistens]EWY38011.1 histidine kinase [Skermanella stibiiresistens SB22]